MTRKQETYQVREGNDRPAKHYEDEHCIQKVVIREQYFQVREHERHLRYRIQK